MKTAVATLDPPPAPLPPRRRRRGVVLGLAAIALAVVALIWHLTALSAFRATEAPAPTASRLASAQLATRLEPWNVRFGWRLVALRGLVLFEEGKVDAAFWLLQPYAQTIRGDEVYRTIYQRVVSVKAPLDARKAHVQHAREQTGGILLEKDVIP